MPFHIAPQDILTAAHCAHVTDRRHVAGKVRHKLLAQREPLWTLAADIGPITGVGVHVLPQQRP